MSEEVNNGNFEELIRSKLEDCETVPDANVWKFVKKSLTGRRRIRYLYIATVSAAAAVTMFLTTVNLPKNNSGKKTETVNRTEIEKKQNDLSASENAANIARPEKIDDAAKNNGNNRQNSPQNTTKTRKTQKQNQNSVKKHATPDIQIAANVSSSKDSKAIQSISPSELQMPVADNPPQKNISEQITLSQNISGMKMLEVPDISNSFKNLATTGAGTENSKVYETEKTGTKFTVPKISRSLYSVSVNIGASNYQNIIETGNKSSSMLPVGAVESAREYSKSSHRTDLMLPDNVEVQYGIPMSAKVSIRKNINKTIAIETGLNYTNFSTKYKYNRYLVKQRLHYLGIPLNLVCNAISKPDWNLYASAGGMVEKGIYANIERNDNIKNSKINMNGVQLSANVAIGASYTLYRNLGMFVEPQMGYFFNCDQPESVRTASPLSFGLGVGLRYGL